MKKTTLLLFALLSITLAHAQNNLTVTYSNGTTKQIKGKLKADKYGFYNEIVIKDNQNIGVNGLVSISSSKAKYSVKKYNDFYYAFENLIENENMSLYKSKNKYFLESDDYKFSNIPFKKKKDYTFSVFDAGILGVYVNKCQASQDYIHEHFYSIKVSDLKKIINSYNSCDLEKTSTVSNKSIKEANQPSELVDFGVTIGNSFLNVDYSGVSVDSKQNYSLFNIGAIITFKPNILKRKLNYSFSLNYMFSKENTFIVDNKKVSAKHGFIKSTLSANYLFLDADNKTNPYIGIAGGLLFNNGTRVNANPLDTGSFGTHYVGSSELIYNINAGVLINALNQKFNFNVSYIPNTKLSLEPIRGLSNYKHYNLKGFNARLSYYF